MKALEMKIAVPEVNGGRCVPAKMKDGHALAKLEIGENKTSSITESELECRINPNTFAMCGVLQVLCGKAAMEHGADLDAVRDHMWDIYEAAMMDLQKGE